MIVRRSEVSLSAARRPLTPAQRSTNIRDCRIVLPIISNFRFETPLEEETRPQNRHPPDDGEHSLPRSQPTSEYTTSISRDLTAAADTFTRSTGQGEPSLTFFSPESSSIVIGSTSCAFRSRFSRTPDGPGRNAKGRYHLHQSPTTGRTGPCAFSRIRSAHLEGSICMRGHCISSAGPTLLF